MIALWKHIKVKHKEKYENCKKEADKPATASKDASQVPERYI